MPMMGRTNAERGAGRQSGTMNSGVEGLEESLRYFKQRNSRLESEFTAKVREFEGQKVEWDTNRRAVEDIVVGLREKLLAKDLEIQSLAQPYGSYCTSGADPHLLKKSVQSVFHALNNFVLSVRIAACKPSTDIADFSKDAADVSSILFSKFERADLGVEHGTLFMPPGQLSEVSFQEYKVFKAFIEDQEDCHNKTAVEPYMGKFRAFLHLVGMDMDILFPFGQMEESDERRVRFSNLAMHVWMLHKLTLSFDTTNVRVIRAGCEEPFNKEFMETVYGRQDEELQCQGTPPLLVQHLILPGLWINGSIFKCLVHLISPTHREPRTSEPIHQVGTVNGAKDQPQDMNDVGTLASEAEPLELEPHHALQTATTDQCNQPSSLVISDSIYSGELVLDMAADTSHPLHTEQPVNNQTPASSDGGVTSQVHTDVVHVVVASVIVQENIENLKICSPPEGLPVAVHPSTVPENPSTHSTRDKGKLWHMFTRI